MFPSQLCTTSYADPAQSLATACMWRTGLFIRGWSVRRVNNYKDTPAVRPNKSSKVIFARYQDIRCGSATYRLPLPVCPAASIVTTIVSNKSAVAFLPNDSKQISTRSNDAALFLLQMLSLLLRWWELLKTAVPNRASCVQLIASYWNNPFYSNPTSNIGTNLTNTSLVPQQTQNHVKQARRSVHIVYRPQLHAYKKIYKYMDRRKGLQLPGKILITCRRDNRRQWLKNMKHSILHIIVSSSFFLIFSFDLSAYFVFVFSLIVSFRFSIS